MRAPDFWTIREGRDSAPVIRTLLTPVGWAYAAATRRRMARGRFEDAGVPVVSIGNLTLGGTGKTPVARHVRALLQMILGQPVAIVSRGYGGRMKGPVLVDTALHTAADVGDEPLMLARDGMVAIGRDRAAAARMAVRAGACALVLDDGHQNPDLRQRLSLVVVDGQTVWGNGRICPAGPLRERVRDGLARADAVIWMGPAPDEDGLEHLGGFAGPVLHAWVEPESIPLDGPVVGFCGIGRPEKFEDTLKALGADVRALIPFPDHHPYSESDLRRLDGLARGEDATLVTTEKDHARLPAAMAARVRVVAIRLRMADEPALRALLVRALGAA